MITHIIQDNLRSGCRRLGSVTEDCCDLQGAYETPDLRREYAVVLRQDVAWWCWYDTRRAVRLKCVKERLQVAILKHRFSLPPY